MAWVETQSLSFSARHDAHLAGAAARMLDDLEDFRDRLAEQFERTPGDISVVIHPTATQLSLAHPWLPLARAVAAPASRRYFAGWFGSQEIHVLAPEVLEQRASAVPGSLEALRLTPLHEYAHVVVGANNRRLPPPFTPPRFARYAAWAWLCEGAATHFSGQARFLGGAIARRLHEAGRPAFPPSTRDAFLLGGTVFDLLEREQGPGACVQLASRLHPQGRRAALQQAFGASAPEIETAWRRYLTELTELRLV
ncbi:MAG: hypothetical protein ACXVRH_12580 [Thermoleophilaceae bacterium]